MKRFIGNSFNVKNFCEMNFGSGERAILIVNAHRPTIIILDIMGLSDGEIINLVETTSAEITDGCSYKYKIIERIGNTFFLN